MGRKKNSFSPHPSPSLLTRSSLLPIFCSPQAGMFTRLFNLFPCDTQASEKHNNWLLCQHLPTVDNIIHSLNDLDLVLVYWRLVLQTEKKEK